MLRISIYTGIVGFVVLLMVELASGLKWILTPAFYLRRAAYATLMAALGMLILTVIALGLSLFLSQYDP